MSGRKLSRALVIAALLACLTPAGWTQIALPSATSFADRLYPVLEKAACRGCHTSDGVASATRLHFPDEDAPRERVDAFGIALADLVDRAEPTRSLLVNKPTNRIRHTGGERIKPGSAEEKILIEWIGRLATLPEAAVSAAQRRLSASETRAQPDQFLRRLTHSQYNNTVRDLLGDYSRPADRFPPEDFVNGFKNQLRTQGMPPLLAEVYSTTGEKLARNAFRAGDGQGLIPCQPSSAADENCRDRLVRTFGRRAFRRPLTEAEVGRYTVLFDAEARKTGRFFDGARVVVEAMLQSPKFLFHIEGGAGGRFRDYEIASRLSYFLWDTMPDRALLHAADRGELQQASGIERIARRMLADPPARPALDEFFAQWLRFDRVLNTVKDRRRYPEFTPELAAMMVEETRRLLGHLVWNGLNFMNAFTADYGFLNSELTSLYKFPAPPGEFELVKFPPETRRAGLLGQASFLASTAGPVETSPTARGIFVREHLLCQHVPSPPPGVNTNLPEPTLEKPLTMRQRMQAHIENPSCASCHRLMDPIGFGLEHLDGIGRWRNKETIEFRDSYNPRAPVKTVALELGASGEIAGVAESAFSDPRQLGKVLAENQSCQECVVKQMFRYAFGRMETPADRDTIRAAYAAFRDSGFRFKELMVALVRSPQFVEGLQRMPSAAASTRGRGVQAR